MARKQDSIVMGANEEAARKKGHNIIPKVVSVLIAFILWFYVMSVESPTYEKVFSQIPIEIKTAQGSKLTPNLDYIPTVDITVSGRRSELNRLSKEDIKATVDASGSIQPDTYSLPIDVEVPGNFSVVEKSSNILKIDLDERVTISLPIKVVPEVGSHDSYLEIATDSEIEKSAEVVVIEGPSIELDKIAGARVTIKKGEVSSEFSGTEDVVLLGKDGEPVNVNYVTVKPSKVTVTIPVFMTKEIDLEVDFEHGLLDSSNCKVTLSPEKLTVRGPVEVLSAIGSTYVININEKTLDTENHRDIFLTELKEMGVTCVDGTQSVTVDISHVGTNTRNISVDTADIEVKNPDKLEYSIDTDSISIKLRGKNSDLAKVKVEDISISVDLSGISGAGSVTLPLKIEISDKYSETVYELGTEYNVAVTVK
ncbi:MAG: hypothetical protein IKT46_04085 [Clostridia bacterium]|nr:hypothetical protein [Clostridia bacterium]